MVATFIATTAVCDATLDPGYADDVLGDTEGYVMCYAWHRYVQAGETLTTIDPRTL